MISRWQGGLVAVLILLGGYVVADALDVAPGVFTFQDEVEKPQNYPEPGPFDASGAEIETFVGSQPLTEELASRAYQNLTDDYRNTGSAGFIAYDPTTGQEFNFGGDDPKVPASTIKVITGAAALYQFGPEHTLDTTAVLNGDQLYLVGGGDIYLGAGTGNPDGVIGHAGLGDLAVDVAANLKEQDITEVSVAVDSSLFGGELYHPILDDGDQRWVMEMRPLAITNGLVSEGYDDNPDLVATGVFAEALAAEDITVVGDVTRGQAPEATAENTVGVIHSAPLREVVSTMLELSDNSMAEVLGHLIAVDRGHEATFQTAGQSIKEILAANGYTLDGVVFSDSSGLSMDNRITARLLIEVLENSLCDNCELSSLATSMAVSGLRGTLGDRFAATDMAGFVHAKTGSLVEVSSLAGFAYTKGGDVFLFAIILDGLEPGTGGPARLALDDAVAIMAGETID